MWLAFGYFLAGCAYLPPLNRPVETEGPVSPPQLPPEPAPVVEETPPQPDPVIAEPEPAPEPEVAAIETQPPRVAIVLSSRAAAYENVANALVPLLEDPYVYDLTDKSLTPKETFDDIVETGSAVVVAIGFRAAEFSSAFVDIPVVFSQVFNVSELSRRGENMWGVAAIPPLAEQLDAWRELNPDLKNVGAILGDGHKELIEEAGEATSSLNMRFHYRLARSDRETLYLFTRLVPDIDGFWLFPDNRILSSDVLRQMLGYAARHGVQVAVFNEALLSLGAAISAASDEQDVARSIASVVDGLLAGGADSLPEMTPLSRVVLRTGGPTTQRIARGSPTSAEGAH